MKRISPFSFIDPLSLSLSQTLANNRTYIIPIGRVYIYTRTGRRITNGHLSISRV